MSEKLKAFEHALSNAPVEKGVVISQGKKHDKEKLDRFDLIPPDILLELTKICDLPPDIIKELAELYGLGAKKYDDRNWQNGFKWGRVIRALHSHLAKWQIGEKYDKEDGQRHLISVIWCAIALAWFEKHNIGEDDRWRK